MCVCGGGGSVTVEGVDRKQAPLPTKTLDILGVGRFDPGLTQLCLGSAIFWNPVFWEDPY